MKKLFLLPIVGLVAAGCSTTDYYQDDLAVAQRLDDDAQPQEHIVRTERAAQRAQHTASRAEFEQRRDVKHMQAQLDDIDRRISAIESDMDSMSASEREQTEEELSDLRQRQQRAESMLNEAERGDPTDFVEVRDELRNAVNELEIGVYRLLVRDSAETSAGETIQ